MTRIARPIGLALWLALVVGPVQAEDTAAAAAEREAIRNERAAAEARYIRAEADCRQRFAVSGCLNEAQAQKRTALDGLRQRELVLDEAQRKAEAEANAKRLEIKRAEAAARPTPAPRAASAASAAAARPASAAARSERASKRSKTADDAAERAVAQQRRLAEAAERREQVEKRNAERAAKGKKSMPLPVPGAASAAPQPPS
jgi:colicin import membrane protein